MLLFAYILTGRLIPSVNREPRGCRDRLSTAASPRSPPGCPQRAAEGCVPGEWVTREVYERDLRSTLTGWVSFPALSLRWLQDSLVCPEEGAGDLFNCGCCALVHVPKTAEPRRAVSEQSVLWVSPAWLRLSVSSGEANPGVCPLLVSPGSDKGGV